MKKQLLLIMLAGLTASVLYGCGSTEPEQKINNTKIEQSVQKEEAKPKKETKKKGKKAIVLDASHPAKSKYADQYVFNEGTSLETKELFFGIPAGTYEVKNIGDNLACVFVDKAGGEVKETEEGWEEWDIGEKAYSVLIDVGGSNTMEIPKGYGIHIEKPVKISLTKK